jgi:hypothetical protein
MCQGMAWVLPWSSVCRLLRINIISKSKLQTADAEEMQNHVDENACRTEQAGISTECFIKIRQKPSAMDDLRQPLGPIQLFPDVQNTQPLTKIPVERY